MAGQPGPLGLLRQANQPRYWAGTVIHLGGAEAQRGCPGCHFNQSRMLLEPF